MYAICSRFCELMFDADFFLNCKSFINSRIRLHNPFLFYLFGVELGEQNYDQDLVVSVIELYQAIKLIVYLLT